MAEELHVPGPFRPSVVSSPAGVYSLPGGVIGDELGRQVESSVGGLSCHAHKPGLHAVNNMVTQGLG